MSSPRDVYRDDGFRVFRDLISAREAAHFAAELGRISGLQANANSAVPAGQRLAFYQHGGVAANPSLWPLLMHPHIIAAVAEVLDASPKCLPGIDTIDTIGMHASETNAHRDASPSELLDLVVAPGDVIGRSVPMARASRRCCVSSRAWSPPSTGTCSVIRRRRPSVTCLKSLNAARARRCVPSWPGVPVSRLRLLVLDEPTNHLDLRAIEQVESALTTYPGTLLLVTHDRRMLEAVQANRHIDVDRGRVTDR